eukprot:snap_masked-scaffold41_size498431-processed-gene-3.15 protein:Tk00211 transcript:snap_masked-scaffold41_size498431-processed-gene-3.15-mRNA-1 annotation:"dna polymerase iii -type-like"
MEIVIILMEASILAMSAFGVVFFDLETTGFKEPEIVQIGAIHFDGRHTFDEYVCPSKKIEALATLKNNLDVTIDESGDRKMFKILDPSKSKQSRRQEVVTLPPQEALNNFVDWLRRFKNSQGVILVAFNGISYDSKVLLAELEKHQVPYLDVIYGLYDPYLAIRIALPPNVKPNQRDIATFYNVPPVAEGQDHNALFDAANLRQITARYLSHSGKCAEEEGEWAEFVIKEPHFLITKAILKKHGIGQ